MDALYLADLTNYSNDVGCNEKIYMLCRKMRNPYYQIKYLAYVHQLLIILDELFVDYQYLLYGYTASAVIRHSNAMIKFVTFPLKTS